MSRASNRKSNNLSLHFIAQTLNRNTTTQIIIMLLQPAALPSFHSNTFVPLFSVQRCALCNSAFSHTEFPLNVGSSTLYACSHYCKLMYEEIRLDQAGKTPQVVINAKKRKITELSENSHENAVINEIINKKQNDDVTEVNLEYSALILDTNVWISFLPFVQSLKKIQGLQVIVPSIVIQELDSLKVKQGLSLKARAAINFLLEEFSNKAEWIRGQKIEESHKQARGLTAENTPALMQWTNDDHILDCAMYFKNHANVALITQDKALALKAQINQVAVLDVTRLTQRLPVLSEGRYVLAMSLEPAAKRRKVTEHVTEVVSDTTTAHYNKSSAFTPRSLTPTADHVTVVTPRDLPVDVWQHVMTHLPPAALFRVARVNKNVSAAVKDDDTWRQSIRKLFRDTNDVLVPRDSSARAWYSRWRRHTLAWE